MDSFIKLLSNRSRLFHLEPMNVGTYYSESLTSYLARLAEAHCMTAGELLSKEITPILKKPYLTNLAINGGTRFYENAAMLNGIGKAARDFVEALKELTLRSDLYYLTMISLSKIIPTRNLCRSKKAWCSCCLQEWKDKNQIIYEPLLWALQSVSVCLDHSTLLQEDCPNCKQRMPILERRSKPGHCSKCGFWLGETSANISGGDELDFGIAEEIAKTIAEFPAISADIKSDAVSNFLASCMNHSTGGNIAEYSRILCKPKTTVWGWVKGTSLPPMEELAQICNLSGVSVVSVVDIFSEKPLVFKQVSVTYPSLARNQKQTRRKLDKEVLHQQLSAILSDTENAPLPLKEISRRLTVDAKILKSYYPELCELIIQKSKDYQNKQAKERLELAKYEITQTVSRLYSKGIYPSRRAVENAMPYKGSLRRKNVQSVWKALVSTNK